MDNFGIAVLGMLFVLALIPLSLILLAQKSNPSSIALTHLSAGNKVKIAQGDITINGEIVRVDNLLFLRWSGCIFQAIGATKEIPFTLVLLSDKIGGDEFWISDLAGNGQTYELYGSVPADGEGASLSLSLRLKTTEATLEPQPA